MGHVFAAAVAAGEERSRNPSWELQGSATNFFDIAGNPARAAEARVFRLERKAPDASEVPRGSRVAPQDGSAAVLHAPKSDRFG